MAGHPEARIHPQAEVEEGAEVGRRTRIWHLAQVRSGARIGADCNIGRGVYIDGGVVVGNRVKIQNYVSVYNGVTVEDGVLVGPHAVFTNDKRPRAVTPTMRLKGPDDWQLVRTLVRQGASIGANAVLVCGITVGRWAMIGAGAVVTRDVPDHGLVVGNPARLIGYVCACGNRLTERGGLPVGTLYCRACDRQVRVGEGA
jgi:UDP-2-acetamido-3-amino-2,3-dideoxy-glucuronate N-acetyltransferase